jgi:hypothetical protein
MQKTGYLVSQCIIFGMKKTFLKIMRMFKCPPYYPIMK